MKQRTRWLDRRIAAPGPYLAVCLSEPEFKAAAAHLNAGQARYRAEVRKAGGTAAAETGAG